MPRLTRLAIPAIAAALALAAATPMVADVAFARPARPDVHTPNDRLRAENEELRYQLGQYQAAYHELDTGLDRIEAVNRRSRDRRTMTMIFRTLRDTRARAAGYVEQQPPQIQVEPMTSGDFDSLSRQVARASFADDKLAVIQTAAQTNYVTVDQVVALMKLVSFDDTRIEIAVVLAPRILDRDRMFDLYGALSFSSSRDSLRQRLGDRE